MVGPGAAARLRTGRDRAVARRGAVQLSGWQARLALGFGRRAERTRLLRRRHSGPLLVQRPFYPERGGVCHVYLLHPPGGVVGGDALDVDIRIDTGDALITTPAAGKFYRSAGPEAIQTQRLRVAAGASLEWLPQESIVYRGARLRSLLRVDLAGDGGFIGWEILCLGRPAAGEVFDAGRCEQRIELWRDGVPLLIERGCFDAAGDVGGAAWGLRGEPVSATLFAAGRLDRALLDELREALAARVAGVELCALGAVDDALVCRYLGPSTQRARELLSWAWRRLRPALLNRPACPPRAWAT